MSLARPLATSPPSTARGHDAALDRRRACQAAGSAAALSERTVVFGLVPKAVRIGPTGVADIRLAERATPTYENGS